MSDYYLAWFACIGCVCWPGHFTIICIVKLLHGLSAPQCVCDCILRSFHLPSVLFICSCGKWKVVTNHASVYHTLPQPSSCYAATLPPSFGVSCDSVILPYTVSNSLCTSHDLSRLSHIPRYTNRVLMCAYTVILFMACCWQPLIVITNNVCDHCIQINISAPVWIKHMHNSEMDTPDTQRVLATHCFTTNSKTIQMLCEKKRMRE